MSLPPISPTGAMSSGNYVDYMIGYNNEALDYLTGQIKNYIPDNIIGDWDNQWLRTINDIESMVIVLNNDITEIKTEIQMIKDIL